MQISKGHEFTGHKAAIYSMCISPKEGHFITCGSEGIVAEWNIATGEGHALVSAPAAVFSLCPLPEQQMLLLGLQNGEVVFADLAEGKIKRRVQLHQKAVFDFLPHPDGKHFFACSEDGHISIWDIATCDHLHLQKISSKSLRTLRKDAAGLGFFAGGSDGHIRHFDFGLSMGMDWEAHALSVFRLELANGLLYSTGRDAHIKSWSVANGQAVLQADVAAHMYAVNDLVYSKKSGLLLSGSMDKSIKIWNPDKLQLLKVVNFEKNLCHWNGVNRLLWLDEGFLSCSDDRKVMRWTIEP